MKQTSEKYRKITTEKTRDTPERDERRILLATMVLKT